jgi:hypothetical protein
MDALVKIVPSFISKTIKPRHKAQYFGKSCDPQSQCAKSARDIFALLGKKKDLPQQNELIREEIWVILDHEKVLSKFQCSALSKLTLQELLRLMLKCKADEELILFVEAMDAEMDSRYSPLVSHWYAPAFNMQALIHKHMGHGMEYLKEMRNSKRQLEKACSSSGKASSWGGFS